MRAKILAMACVVLAAGPALADWRYDGGEGSYYAYTTDGGFVEGSYRNGLMFFCPDNGRPCELRVTINGQVPEPRVVVSFAFPDGNTIQRVAEEVDGGPTQIGWEGGLIENLESQGSVTVSVGDRQGHTFSLGGSSNAIRQAMNP